MFNYSFCIGTFDYDVYIIVCRIHQTEKKQLKMHYASGNEVSLLYIDVLYIVNAVPI